MDKESVPHKMVSDPEGYSDLLDLEDRRICETGLLLSPRTLSPRIRILLDYEKLLVHLKLLKPSSNVVGRCIVHPAENRYFSTRFSLLLD